MKVCQYFGEGNTEAQSLCDFLNVTWLAGRGAAIPAFGSVNSTLRPSVKARSGCVEKFRVSTCEQQEPHP